MAEVSSGTGKSSFSSGTLPLGGGSFLFDPELCLWYGLKIRGAALPEDAREVELE